MNLLHALTFVSRSHEEGDVYMFSFTTDGRLAHKAGQHGIFILPGFHRPHPFSLTSAPHEEFITFATHTNTDSPFKRKLMNMQPGASIYMLGPIMNFTFIKDTPRHVFLAQGIGITPFHSMLVHAHHKELPVSTTLIHVDSKPHAFKETTEQFASQALYPSGTEEFQTLVKQQDTDQMFYLSGSPRFVRTTKKLLKKRGVARSSIKTDSFLGY